MRMYDLIMKKRNGGELTGEEIDFFVKGYTKGEIPDYQVSAFMMAIYFQKMTEKETYHLTMAMAHVCSHTRACVRLWKTQSVISTMSNILFMPLSSCPTMCIYCAG